MTNQSSDYLQSIIGNDLYYDLKDEEAFDSENTTRDKTIRGIITDFHETGFDIVYTHNFRTIAKGKFIFSPMCIMIDGAIPDGIVKIKGIMNKNYKENLYGMGWINGDNTVTKFLNNFYSSANIYIEHSIKNNKIDGLVSVYCNSSLKSEIQFEDNYANGFKKEYYDISLPLSLRYILEFFFIYKEPALRKEAYLISGKIQGKEKEYSKKGQLIN